jgi:hypothetical protein
MAGKIVTVDGKTSATPGPATTTPMDLVPKTLTGTNSFAKSMAIRHLSGAGDLRVYFNQTTSYITIKANESFYYEGLVTSYRVVSSTGTVEWEAVTEV